MTLTDQPSEPLRWRLLELCCDACALVLPGIALTLIAQAVWRMTHD